MKSILSSVALATFGVLFQCNAAAFDGQTLYKYMRSSDPLELMIATGYIAGVEDVLGTTNPMKRGFINCSMPRVDVEQRDAVVKKYLAEHPDKWNSNAPLLIEDAMLKAFPCPDFPGLRKQYKDAASTADGKESPDSALKSCKTQLSSCKALLVKK